MPTETGRHRLYEKIKEQWGEEHAIELMSYLPPVGWADVATKHDLATLGAELRAEMARLEATIDARIERGFKDQLRWLVGAMVALTAIFSAIVGLVG